MLQTQSSSGQIQVTTENQQQSVNGTDTNSIHEDNSCKCEEYECLCCLHVHKRTYKIDNTICVGAIYEKENYEIDLKIKWDDKVVKKKVIEGRNPPEICVNIPIPKLEVRT